VTCGPAGSLANFPPDLNPAYTGGPTTGQCNTAVQAAPLNASDPALQNGTLTIPANTTAQMLADVTVPNGLTLALASGATLQQSANAGLYVQSGGSLTATGATITAPAGSLGKGIDFQGGSTGLFNNTQILNLGGRALRRCFVATIPQSRPTPGAGSPGRRSTTSSPRRSSSSGGGSTRELSRSERRSPTALFSLRRCRLRP